MLFAAETTVVEFPRLGWGPWKLNRFVVEDLFGRFSIAWYGLIICCAMIGACLIIMKNATKREGFKSESFTDYYLASIPLSIVGARLMYVLTSLDKYRSFWDVFKIWEGGLAVYGGVILGFSAIALVARIKKENFFQVMDAIVPGLILAQCIGRWGNFVNGEAHGYETGLPWGMVVNGEGPFHPTFLYESLLTLTGFLLMEFVLYRRKKFHGELLCFYFVWYGVGRACIEGLRTDSLYFGPLRASQVIGIVSAAGGLVLAFFLWRSARNAPKTGSQEEPEKTDDNPEGSEEPQDETPDGSAKKDPAENPAAEPEKGGK